jgi:hypothetical protein
METNPAASIRIVALSGSLRRKSYNTAALYAAGELMPPGADFDIMSLDGLPLFNADIEQSSTPPVVAAFREALRRADGRATGEARRLMGHDFWSHGGELPPATSKRLAGEHGYQRLFNGCQQSA